MGWPGGERTGYVCRVTAVPEPGGAAVGELEAEVVVEWFGGTWGMHYGLA